MERSYTRKPYVFDFIHEALRRHRFGRELSEDLLVRGVVQWFTEIFVFPTLRIARSTEPGKFHRDIVSLLDQDDLERIASEPDLKTACLKLIQCFEKKFREMRALPKPA